MNTGPTAAQRRACAVFAALAICASTVGAGELEYRAITGVGYTDNARRIPTDEIDETIGTVGLRFAYNEDSKLLHADVVGDLAYNKYFNDTFESRVIGNLFADGAFQLVPDRIVWAATDQFGQVLGDPFLPATVENSEDINYFSTGPDFYLGLGSQTRLRVGGRYSLTTYERSPLDFTSTAGEAAIIRVISDRRLLSLNARVEQVEYDDETLDQDFDQVEGYVRYEATGRRTNVSFDVGASQLDRKSQDEKQSGALLRVNMVRQISGSSFLSLSGGRQFSTAAGAFISEQGIANTGLSTTPGRQTAQPFTYDHGVFGWRYNRNRTGIQVTANWSQRTYEENPEFDLGMQSLNARYRRELSPRTALEFSATYGTADYADPVPDYKDFGAGVEFSWHLTREITVGAKYDFNKRDSDSPIADFNENRLWLTIGYGRGEPRATRIEPNFGLESVPNEPGE